MKNENLVLLLQIIKNKGNTDNLISLGFQYSQVSKYIVSLIENKLVFVNEEGLQLTNEGESKLIDLNILLRRRNSKAWISPQEQYFTEKKDKFDIYLPKE